MAEDFVPDPVTHDDPGEPDDRMGITRAELDRLHADYNERLNALSAKLVRYRHAVAAVRSIHHPDRPEFTDNYNYEGDYDVCSACTTDPHLVRWPCNTIKAIEEAIQP